jgi:hypothetical protein
MGRRFALVRPCLVSSRLLVVVLALLGGCGRLGFDRARQGGLSLDLAEAYTATDTFSFAGRCTGLLPVSIGGEERAETACEAGRFQFTTSPRTTDGPRTYVFRQTAPDRVTEVVNGIWTRDTVPPELLGGRARWGDGEPTTSRRFLRFAFAGVDAMSPIVGACVRVEEPSMPATDDACWAAIDGPLLDSTPARSVEAAYPAVLGFTPGTYATSRGMLPPSPRPARAPRAPIAPRSCTPRTRRPK